MLLGAVAQLGERLNGIQEVSGSIPLSSTPSVNRFIDEKSLHIGGFFNSLIRFKIT